jgi:hypothetical protein
MAQLESAVEVNQQTPPYQSQLIMLEGSDSAPVTGKTHTGFTQVIKAEKRDVTSQKD